MLIKIFFCFAFLSRVTAINSGFILSSELFDACEDAQKLDLLSQLVMSSSFSSVSRHSAVRTLLITLAKIYM